MRFVAALWMTPYHGALALYSLVAVSSLRGPPDQGPTKSAAVPLVDCPRSRFSDGILPGFKVSCSIIS
jgi:hypothetical protein